MKNQTIALVFAVILAAIFAIVLGMHLGPQPDDLKDWRDRFEDKHGVSPVEYYQANGEMPVSDLEPKKEYEPCEVHLITPDRPMAEGLKLGDRVYRENEDGCYYIMVVEEN